MTGNIIGDPVRDYVDEQIDLRQKIQGAGYANNPIDKSPKVINYLNNRSAWIKMASGVSISGSAGMEKLKTLSSSEDNYITDPEIENLMGHSLAKNVILFNTVQSLSKFAERGEKGTQTKSASYTKRSGVRTDNALENSLGKMYGGLGGNSRGLQPVPGITDISIECINRGSIRKAVVNLKAYNKFQFGIIEILYLRLGYIMMLEWGWDKYISGFNESTNEVEIKNTESTIIENEWFKTNGTTQSEMINLIDKYRDRYQGNYDGFFGKVSNFNWTLNRDNTYDITINLITMGSVIESLQVNLPTVNVTLAEAISNRGELAEKFGLEEIKNEENSRIEYEGEENTILANLGSDAISQFISNIILNFFIDGKVNEKYAGKDYIYLPNLTIKSPEFTTTSLRENLSQKTGDAFNRKKIPPSQRYYIRFGEFLIQLEKLILDRVENQNSPLEGVLTFDKTITSTYCNYEKNVIPVSPSKVIFSVCLDDYFSGIVSKGVIEKINGGLEKFVENNNGVLYGLLMNCYLNLNFIAEALNSTTDSKGISNLYKFLEILCNGINESTGNVTNIEPAIKEDKIIYFLEQNSIKGYDSLSKNKPKKETEIEAYGYNPIKGTSNFVKDFSFQTKITPDLLNMISISATAGDSDTKNLGSISLQKLSDGLVNRFAENITNTTTPPLLPSEKKEIELKAEFARQINSNNIRSITGTAGIITFIIKFTYKTKTFEILRTSPVVDKGTSENLELYDDILSKAVDKSKDIDIEIKNLEKSSKIRLVDSITDGFQNYEVYLANAFGGTPKVATIKSKLYENYKGELRLKRTNIPQSNSKWWYLNSNPNFTSQGKNALRLYREAVNRKQYKEKGILSSNLGFIPLDLGITFDGLSGIRIYDKININTKFLPSQYPNNIKFVATKVNHKVSENIWETSISTLSTPKTDIPPYDTEYTGEIIPQTPSGSSIIVGTNGTNYPELPKIEAPKLDLLPLNEAITTLNQFTDDKFARAAFAVILAESKLQDGNFVSVGGHNYAGVQTDSGRWSRIDSKFISKRFQKIDSGGGLREFAYFEDNLKFLKFMANVISNKFKNFDGKNSNEWVKIYIQKWWNPPNASKIDEESDEFKSKKNIFELANNLYKNNS